MTKKILSLLLCFCFFGSIYAQSVQKITIKNPGTLEKALSKEQWNLVEELIVKGDINKDDFRFIANLSKENGKLRAIDLKKTQLNEVGMKLFEDNQILQTIILPNTITAIGKEAFSGCTNLNKIILSNRLNSIGSKAFKNCKSLTSISIGKYVNWIGDGTFDGCSSKLQYKIAKGNSDFHIGENGAIYNRYGRQITE